MKYHLKPPRYDACIWSNECVIVWTVYSLDEDPLMATFAVFMHTMLSAALDASFLASIVQNEEGTMTCI